MYLNKWMEMGAYRSEVSSVFFFFSLSCFQEDGLEINKNNKQSGDKEESILNGPSVFSEKLERKSQVQIFQKKQCETIPQWVSAFSF